MNCHICNTDNSVNSCAHYYCGKESEANAKLIAAAPDMLKALQYVVKWHREHDTGEGELFGLDYVTTCISAIHKAVPEYYKNANQQ